MDASPSRRELLARAALGALGTALPATLVAATKAGASGGPTAVEPDFPGRGPVPWIKRLFHLYTGGDGLTRAELLPVEVPPDDVAAQLIRRTAARVTIGGSPAGHGWDFHVANHPTLLIPLFGTMIITLHDGASHELRYGDMAIAEDCTGKGHISRTGPDGCLMVSVQLPKDICPKRGSSDMTRFWRE